MAKGTWITLPPSMAPARSEGAPPTPHPMSQPTARLVITGELGWQFWPVWEDWVWPGSMRGSPMTKNTTAKTFSVLPAHA